MNIPSDKEIERRRYDLRSKNLLSDSGSPHASYINDLPQYLVAPYECFRQKVISHINNDHQVLEIGAGSGALTPILADTGAEVMATDISEQSLQLLSRRLESYDNLMTRVADMESLPFEDGVFDAVVSAGSLSYGDNQVVMKEIMRVLKRGGVFICVDSLNHHPVYRRSSRIT